MSDDVDMTSRESSLETLRETHSFPCEYVFKVIGANDEEFVARVVEVGTRAIEGDAEPTVETEESGQGSYISVTMHLEVDEAEAVLAVYEEVGEIEDVRMML